MPYRYENRGTIDIDKRDMFKQIKVRRDLDSISLISTAKFNRLDETALENLEFESYIWKRGDRFYKLAHDFYGDQRYWWVIALFNQAPTEQHVAIGEEIFIPLEMELLASLYGVL